MSPNMHVALSRLPRPEVEGLLVEAIEALRNRSFATMPELASYLEARVSTVAEPRFQGVVAQRQREASARAERALQRREASRAGSAASSSSRKPAEPAQSWPALDAPDFPPPKQQQQQQAPRAAPPPRAAVPPPPPASVTASARSAAGAAQTAQGGLIFGCSDETYDECMQKKLLGVPESQFRSRIQKIQPFNTALFMYNYSKKRLYGVFEAVAPGDLNIDPTAWQSAMARSRNLAPRAGAGSPFPAQVRFQVVHEFPSLPQSKFGHIVTWKDQKAFDFILTADQVSQLMTAFIAEQSASRGRR